MYDISATYRDSMLNSSQSNQYLFIKMNKSTHGILTLGYKTFITCLLLTMVSFSTTNIYAQTAVVTPCGVCSVMVPIGTTGDLTYIDELGFEFSSTRCYLIKGTLVINQTTNWYGLRLKMEEKSKILVQADLSISNCYLSGCGDMWQGIETDGQVDLFLYNSFVEDANIGIKLSTLVGFVCTHTEFINDYVGIACGSPFDEDQQDEVIHRGQIWGCSFYTNTTLPDPYPGHPYYPSWPTTPTEIPYNQGFAAIYLTGLSGLNIGYVNAVGSDRNNIYQMRNGIILRQTTSNISGTDFYDFEGNIPDITEDPILDLNQHAVNLYRSTSDIVDNTFDNLMIGIHGTESTDTIRSNEITLSTPNPGYNYTRGILLIRPQVATIRNNIVTDGQRGISIEDVANDFLIKGNTLYRNFFFYSINVGIFVRNAKLDPAQGIIQGNTLEMQDAVASTGIHLINANRILVTDNPISFANGGGHQSRGILGVGVFNSIIRKNTIIADPEYISNGNNGIQLEGSGFNSSFCNSIENFWMNLHIYGPNVQTKIINNQLNDSEYGFAISSPAMIGTQPHFGNKWPVTYEEFGAVIFGDDPVEEALRSLFIVDEAENSDFMPYPIDPSIVASNLWFRDIPTIPLTPECLYFEPDPFVDADTIAKLIRTELEFEEYNDEMTWLMKADIYNMMLEDPSLSSNTVLDSFFDVEVNNPLGKLITWQRDLSLRYGNQPVLKSLIQDTICMLSDSIVYIDSIVALSPNDSATWLALRDLKVDSLVNASGRWMAILDGEEDDSQYAYAAIEDDLDNLTTTNDLEAYLKQALLFKTQYLTRNAFSSGDSADLVTLGELCPWEGGRAIAVAHELYHTIDNNSIWPTSDNCGAPPRPFISKPDNGSTYIENIFSMAPNPAFDLVELRSEYELLEVVVSNLQMQPIVTYNPLNRKFAFSISDFPSGIYFITGTTGIGSFTQKLIHAK